MAERGERGAFTQGQFNSRRRGRGRGRGQGWGGGRDGFRYRSPHNPNKFRQTSIPPRFRDVQNFESNQQSPRQKFPTHLKLDLGESKICAQEDVVSPGSSSSSKRSCTEMEDNDDNSRNVSTKKKCKKTLSGNFICSHDDDNRIPKGKVIGRESRPNINAVISEGEDWDEEIRLDQLDGRKISQNEAASWEIAATGFDGNTSSFGKADGLMLVQESYPTSGSNGTDHSKDLEGDILPPAVEEVRQMDPRKVLQNKVVDCLSSAVTENCTCTSDEETFKNLGNHQKNAVNKPRGVRSFSSPTAGSKIRPCVPSISKSDSWTCSVLNQGSTKKKGKLKKKHRAVSIQEYQDSTDDDAEVSQEFPKGERAKSLRQKKASCVLKTFKNVEMKEGCGDASMEKSDETKVGVVQRKTHENIMCKEYKEDGDSCEADDSLTDDENWNNVVKKLSAGGADAEEVQQRQPIPPENNHPSQNTMDAPLSFREDYRARFSYPPAYIPYPDYQSMRPPYPYGPPIWPVVAGPYYYGPAVMSGFHPDAIARYPIIHRFPRKESEGASFPPPDPVQTPGTSSQEGFYTVDESVTEPTNYAASVNAAYHKNAYGDRNCMGPEHLSCPDDEYDGEIFVSDFDSSGNQSYVSQEPNDETWKPNPDTSYEMKTPLLPSPLPDIQENFENCDTQSSFISTEDDSVSYESSPFELAPRGKMPNFSEGKLVNTQEESSQSWYSPGMESPTSDFSLPRRKSKVWGLTLKQMTRNKAGDLHNEAKTCMTAPIHTSLPPPSSYAAVLSAKSKNGKEQPSQNRGNVISSAHLEERKKLFPGVTVPQSGWSCRHSLAEFISPQSELMKEKPAVSSFWQGTPSPVVHDPSNKFKSWSAGSQGWGTYNISPIPRPVSAPPKQRMFSEVLQRPRRLTLEDEVRGETIPRLNTWRSSATTDEDEKSEIQYPTSSDIDYLDTHAHIDLLFQRQMFKGTFAKFCLLNKYPANFAGCIAIFCYPVNFSTNYSLAENLLKERNVWGSFGCHPHQVKHYDGIMEQRIKEWMEHPKTVALGEIGLDYSDRPLEMTSDHELQKMIFRRQLQIALDAKKPLVIHCRDAEADTLDIMSEMVPRNHKIHRHCFTGPPQDALTFLRAFPNSFIGLTALVTFPTATNTHQTAKAIPLNRLLLETDTPYFVPRTLRGHRWSHPGMALLVAERIAQLRETTLDDVLSHVRSNTMTMYGI